MFLGNLRKFCTDFLILCVFCKHLEFFDQKILLGQQIYTDKEILADALTAEKAATNNYNAFANECVHDSVRDAILHCLEQEHCIQEDVFNMMHQRGLYPTPDADANKVENAKQKFSQCVKTV